MFIVVHKPEYKYFKEYLDSFKYKNDKILLFSYNRPLSFDSKGDYLFVNTFDVEIMLLCHSKGNSVSILNTEQLTRDWYLKKYTHDLGRLLSNDVSLTLYDYSLFNTSLIPLGLKASRIIPYKCKISEIPDYSVEVDYDVAFVGTKSVRRQKILGDLEDRGVKVKYIESWGEERDKEVQSCKVLLNIHYADDYRVYESIRCDRWLTFGKVVVTETSLDITYPNHEKLIISSYDNLVETVVNSIDVLQNS
jgi:hypothetical protein